MNKNSLFAWNMAEGYLLEQTLNSIFVCLSKELDTSRKATGWLYGHIITHGKMFCYQGFEGMGMDSLGACSGTGWLIDVQQLF